MMTRPFSPSRSPRTSRFGRPLRRATSTALTLAALSLGIAPLPLLSNASFAQQEERALDQTPTQLLDNFAHYTFIARPDLAAAYGQKLIDSGITAAELVVLLDEGTVARDRIESAIARGLTMPELEEVAAELGRLLGQGRIDLARDVERIDEAIEWLTGTLRQQRLAQRRLQEAGEYAIPALLRQITDGRDARLRTRAAEMLREIGLPAVMPLAEALNEIGDAAAQRAVCDILGDVGYPHAAPFLMELLGKPATPTQAREAATRALSRMNVRESDLSNAYTAVARDFFNDAQYLIPYPDEATNNMWRYDRTGLAPSAISTEIFGRVMAMRFASKAIDLNESNADALALFVAANLKRENDMPAGGYDPVYGELNYSPAFYATIFGTSTCLNVLGMAIDNGDTPLVRDAIAALAQTTGGSNLFTYGGDREPLLEALQYPDRRVQYEAALTLGRALPQQSFPGDFSVVSILASAVRTGDELFAMIAGESAEDRAELAHRLEPLNFNIVGSEGNLAALRDAADHAIGIDLIVVRMRSAEATYEMVENLRRMPKTSIAPILVLVDQADLPSVRTEYRRNSNVAVGRPAVSDEAFNTIIETLLERSAGVRIGEAEAEVYAIESLGALRDIAISGSTSYDIRDAEIALLDALFLRSGGTRLTVAEILAMIDSARAQQAIFDAAFSADEFEQVALLDSAAQSVKRFGNHLLDHQVAALTDLVADAEGDVSEAAARLHGALNLPTSAAIKLIP